MNKSTFEEILARDGQLVYTNVGDSMLPLIRQGRDLLVIKPKTGRLKKYDIPLYRRDSGQYVLHRILKVRPDDYVICGDNCQLPPILTLEEIFSMCVACGKTQKRYFL